MGLGLGNALGEDLGVLVLEEELVYFEPGRMRVQDSRNGTYGLVLDLLSLAALEGKTVTLVLETLGSDQSLDLGGLGVRLLALTLGLDLAADDVLADLFIRDDSD